MTRIENSLDDSDRNGLDDSDYERFGSRTAQIARVTAITWIASDSDGLDCSLLSFH